MGSKNKKRRKTVIGRRSIPILLLILLFIYLSINGCTKGEGKTTKTIKVTGSTTVLPVLSNAAELFSKVNPNVSHFVRTGSQRLLDHLAVERQPF